MSSESQEISLKDSVKFIVDNRGKTAPTATTGVALIATNCVNNSALYPERLNLRYVSQETYDSWFRAHPLPGDILLTNKGSQNGAVCLVPSPVDFCIAQDMVALRADDEKIYSLYLFAALRSEVVQQRMKALNVDAVIPHLKKTDFDKLLVPLPARKVQEWIGDSYFELSARIELLRNTNATLESIAQALFKSWFIDFDPVRAKAEGREPEGMDADTAALLPAGFEESALGVTPTGWQSMKLGDLVELTKGCSYKGDGLSEVDGAHMFNLGCFNAHRVFAAEKVKRYTGDYRPRHAVIPWDLIIANTDMTQARDILGRPVFVPDGFEPGFISHHVFKVTVKVSEPLLADAIRLFLFFALQQEGFRERAIGFATGTTVLALPAAAVTECPACIPPESALVAFAGATRPLLERIRLNERQADMLAQTRDMLLSRLISGKLRVPETALPLEVIPA